MHAPPNEAEQKLKNLADLSGGKTVDCCFKVEPIELKPAYAGYSSFNENK